MRARLVLAALLGLFAFLTLVDRFVLVELLVRRTAIPLGMALIVAVACIGIGALSRGSDEADPALDFILGLPLLGTLCFVLGLLKVNLWTMLTPVMIFTAAGVLLLVAGLQTRRLPVSAGPGTLLGLLAVGAVLACAFVAAQAPPTSLDEVAYHLAVPQAWVLEGRAVDLPLLSHSYFPLGVESADLPALVLLGAADGGVASHFLHLLAALATILLIARRTDSWLATAAIATTPALALTAGWSLVDWPLAGLFVATYVALENDDTRTASAATAAGLLTKYTFLPFALLAWVTRRKRPHWIVLAGVVFFLRNLILTFNPIAPFLGPDAPHVAGFRALALADYVFDAGFIDESLGAAIVMLPAFAAGAVAVGSALLALALFFLAPSARILVPFLVVPSLHSGAALRKRWMAVFIGLAVVVQTFLVIWFTARAGAFSLIAGGVSEDEYLRQQRGTYAATAWIDQNLPRDGRALVVGTGETFWFARKVRGGGNFDGPRVSRYLDVPAPEALRERMRRDGITHVAVIEVPVPTKNARKVEERQMTLSPAAQRMLARTLNRYTASVTSRGGATLFTLR